MEFPEFIYSKRELGRVGESLKGVVLGETPEQLQNAQWLFQIANSWRASHFLPMNSIRRELAGHVGRLSLGGVTASRLKRMVSIRQKLRRFNIKISHMQDIGGCRVVLPTISDLEILSESFLDKTRHYLINRKDYILEPKADGYRCRHLVVEFNGGSRYPQHSGRRIEIQLRTRLQH